jgi:hypothetical protein
MGKRLEWVVEIISMTQKDFKNNFLKVLKSSVVCVRSKTCPYKSFSGKFSLVRWFLAGNGQKMQYM